LVILVAPRDAALKTRRFSALPTPAAPSLRLRLLFLHPRPPRTSRSSGLGVRTRELFIRRSLSDDITTVLALNHNVRPVTSRCDSALRALPCQRELFARVRVLLVFALLKSANNYFRSRNARWCSRAWKKTDDRTSLNSSLIGGDTSLSLLSCVQIWRNNAFKKFKFTFF